MKLHPMLSAILFMFCCLYSSSNWAWGHHGGHGGGSFGFYFGAPLYPYGYGYGYPYAYPYYPPVVVTVPVTPPTYIQQAPQAPVVQQSQTAYWHYCNNPQGYYPYVKECPGGWQLVEPTPPR